MFIYAFYLRMKHHFPHTRIDLSDMRHYHAHHGYDLHRAFQLPHDEFCISQPVKKVVEFLFFKTLLERKQPQGLAPYEKRYWWPFVYFKGFWQSEKFFADIADEVRAAFTFNASAISAKTKAMAEQIAADPCAVSLHVRRGDYLQPKFYKDSGCVCQLPYYRNAVKGMLSRHPEAHFYIFSDDVAWARENLPAEGTYVDWNKGEDSWQDMFLMSRCKHNIIANSTFSWWGAWLNANKAKTVVAPCRWFMISEAPDILPKEWVKVEID